MCIAGKNGEGLAHLLRGYAEAHAVTQTGPDIYGQDWGGQQATQFDSQLQAAAISALLGSMVVGSEFPDDGPDENSKSDSSASFPKGAIAGCVIGGALVVSLIAGAVWFYVWKNRRVRGSSDPEINPTPFPVSTPSEDNLKSRRGMKLAQGQDTFQPITDGTADGAPENHGSPRNHSTPGNDGAAAPAASVTAQAIDVTMEDLLLALTQQVRNERMRNERGWDSQESPPQYLESERDQGNLLRLPLV
ncbi:hypothetical protein V5O48_004219 [Marasmius crinis-equi]|uniref:Uncharacterized protein n=1 Tax=Marasmius crinis-equi TaxID=585013 RepID=A0ABR3FRM0_9AGAR